MPDEPIESQTVETPPDGDVPPAGSQEQESGSASSEAGRTTDATPTVEDLQAEIARERALREKAEKHSRAMESRAQRSLVESEKLRQETLRKVNQDLADLQRSMDERIEEGEAITRAELDRRDTLLEQRFLLQQNAAAEAERASAWEGFRDTVVDKATALGMTEDDIADFWRENTVMVYNPQTGKQEPRIFGEFDDPKRAERVALALLKDRTDEAHESARQEASDQKADALARKKIARALPAGSAPKPEPPADPHQAYKDAVMKSGNEANPDKWF